jgi:hypothetical protein
MGYKALVTLDLPGVTKDQREIFYQVLTEEKWTKIPNMDTAWKISFADNFTRASAISLIKNHLNKAKEKSRVEKVYYSTQLDTNDVIVDNI